MRMFRAEKFLGSMRVGRKLTASFVLVIILMATASIAGLVTSRASLPKLDRMLTFDVALARESTEATANLVELRGVERSILLDIGNPAKLKDHQTKWEASYAEELTAFE